MMKDNPKDIVEIKFVNSDATPKIVTGLCDRNSVANIMAWYGSHFAGNRYAVYVGGEKVKKDQNGELVP